MFGWGATGTKWRKPVRRPHSLQARFPIARFAFHVHDGYDPEAIILFQVDDSIRKNEAEMAVDRRVKLAKLLGVSADFAHQSLHLQVESLPEPWVDSRVVSGCFRQFDICGGMKNRPH